MNRAQESGVQGFALGVAVAAVAVASYPMTVAIACPEWAPGSGGNTLCILGPIVVLWPICLAVAGFVTAVVVGGLLGAAAILLGVELASVALAFVYPNGFGGLQEGDLLDEALGYAVIAVTVMLVAYAIGRLVIRLRRHHAGEQTMGPAREDGSEATTITRNALIAGGLILTVGLGLIFVDPPSGGSRPPDDLAPPLETPYWGSGYALSPDATVAYRWLEPTGTPCLGVPGRCWQMELVAEFGCPASLEVEVTMLDATGSTLGSVKDRTGGVMRGQTASIRFSVIDDRVQFLEIRDAICE